MRTILAALVSGLLFGAGLTVSQMVNPAKVLGFLDIAGAWDPSLAFVLGGAVAVWGAAFAVTKRMRAPVFAASFAIPNRRDIDAKLVGGAALFGIGWGLVGYCPGPAISSLALGRWEPAVFLAAMLAGMFAYRLIPQAPSDQIRADA
ncbi:MAG TPA: DUF6691 family protein [Alphaproteobacteria bacterium]|nr:DUF6691 family protein [Alphaproteobacteria bacterium]